MQVTPRRGAVHLLWIAALAGWLAVSWVLPYAHQATVAHRRCSEHGELVHVARVELLHVEATVPSSDSEVWRSAVAASHDDDAHCSQCPSSAGKSFRA